MRDLPPLAAALLANFHTIRFPRSEDRSTPSFLSRSDWCTTAKARRAEHLAAEAYRRQLRQRLHDGHHRFLDHLEPGPEGWRLHIFAAGDAALSLLDGIADRECVPGDPVSFDPEEFVIQRLGYLKQSDSDFE